MKTSYPVTREVRVAIEQYPLIKQAFVFPQTERSDRELVRLLSNTHYDHIRRLLEFIDKWMERSAAIGSRVIKSQHPFELSQVLAELYLFGHLCERLGGAVQAAEAVDSSTCPDIEIRVDDLTVRIEVYTPVELMGFQLFERYVPLVLKYLDVPCGYHLEVKTIAIQDGPRYEPERLYYPYTIPEENEVYTWLEEFSREVLSWLKDGSPEKTFRMKGPGGKVEIVIRLTEILDERRCRHIDCLWATRSTDTTLFFKVGTVQDTANSEWGRKIKAKLQKQQCGPPAPDVLRILVVNFSLADTAWPHFISEERFTVRFRDVVNLLVGGKDFYDAVLPAQLGFECCFGEAVWLNERWEDEGKAFLSRAGLTTPCEPPPAAAPEEIENFLNEIGAAGRADSKAD